MAALPFLFKQKYKKSFYAGKIRFPKKTACKITGCF